MADLRQPTGRRADRLGEDLAERCSQGSAGLAAGCRVPPGDEPVRADQDRAAVAIWRWRCQPQRGSW